MNLDTMIAEILKSILAPVYMKVETPYKTRNLSLPPVVEEVKRKFEQNFINEYTVYFKEHITDWKHYIEINNDNCIKYIYNLVKKEEDYNYCNLYFNFLEENRREIIDQSNTLLKDVILEISK